MTIAYDASSSPTAGTGTLSWTHTPVGTPKGALVFVVQNGTSDIVTNISYGGANLVQVCPPFAKTAGDEDGQIWAYYRGNDISSGAQTVVVAKRGSTDTMQATATTLTGATDTAVEAFVSAEGNSNTTFSANIETRAGLTCYVAGAIHTGKDSVADIGPGTGYSNVLEYDFGTQVGAFYRRTSNATGGTVAFAATHIGAGVDDYGLLAVAVCEVNHVVTAGDYPDGFTVPQDETWLLKGTVTTPKNVVNNGRLVMRPGSILEFRNINENAFGVGGGLVVVDTDIGLWSMQEGHLDAIGTQKTSWHQAAGAIAVNTNTVTLAEEPINWQVGDKLFITPTARAGAFAYGTTTPAVSFANQFEDVTITAIAGTTVTFTPNTKFAHPTTTFPDPDNRVFTAEVGNLTRDVEIRGRSGALAYTDPAGGGRTHIFMHGHHPQFVKWIEVSNVTPNKSTTKDAFILGRWGLHIHHGFDDVRGTLFEGIAVHDFSQRGLVQHASHGTTARDVIAYRSEFGNHFWWDQDVPGDASDDTLWDHCLAARQTKSGAGALFNMTGGRRNLVRDSVAGGGNNGASPSAHGFHWQAPGTFVDFGAENIVSHNIRGSAQGMRLWDSPAQGSLRDDGRSFVIDGVDIYHCDTSGVGGAYSNPWVIRNMKMFENGTSRWQQHVQSGLFEDCDFWSDARPYGAETRNHESEAGPNVYRRCSFRNYTSAAYAFIATADIPDTGAPSTPENALFEDCEFEGTEFFLKSDIHPRSRIEVDDEEHGHILLRQVNQEGLLVPEWNARIVALDGQEAPTAPTWAGSGGVVASTGNAIPPLPTGWNPNDIFFLTCETGKQQAVAAPTGWTQTPNSPQEALGFTASDGYTRLTTFWRRAEAGDTAPTVVDPGDHVLAVVVAVRGCRTTGDPWNATSGGIWGPNAGRAFTPIPGATAMSDNNLVLLMASAGVRATDVFALTGVNGGWKGRGLANVQTRDRGWSSTVGDGGSLIVATGERATVGVFAETDYYRVDADLETGETPGPKGMMAFVLDGPLAPTFVAAGTNVAGTGNVIPDLPAGWQEDDVFFLITNTESADAVATPAGWEIVPGSPQATGGGGAVNPVRLSVFYRKATSSETAPTITDPGQYVQAVIVAVRGCPTYGRVWDAISGGINTAAPGSAVSVTGATTTKPQTLALIICADGRGTPTAQYGEWTNVDLEHVTTQVNVATTAGASLGGGAMSIATGVKSYAGAFGASTNTLTQGASYKAFMTIALKGIAFSDVQENLAGLAAGTSSATGRLTVGSEIDLSGASAGASSAVGTLRARRTLRGTSDGTSDAHSSGPEVVIRPVFVVTTTSLPRGSTEDVYATVLEADNGREPYTWTVADGSLPSGLTLDPDGTISGTPDAAGTSTFTVEAADAADEPHVASATFSIRVRAGFITYPNDVDDLGDPNASDDLDTSPDGRPHSRHHKDLNDVVEELMLKVGETEDVDDSTVDARLADVEVRTGASYFARSFLNVAVPDGAIDRTVAFAPPFEDDTSYGVLIETSWLTSRRALKNISNVRVEFGTAAPAGATMSVFVVKA